MAPLFKLCGIHTDVVGMYTIDLGAGNNSLIGVNLKKNEGKNFSSNKTSAYLKVEDSFSAVECSAWDRGIAGLSITGSIVLCHEQDAHHLVQRHD